MSPSDPNQTRPYGIEEVLALLEADRFRQSTLRLYYEAMYDDFARRPRHPAEALFQRVA